MFLTLHLSARVSSEVVRSLANLLHIVTPRNSKLTSTAGGGSVLREEEHPFPNTCSKRHRTEPRWSILGRRPFPESVPVMKRPGILTAHPWDQEARVGSNHRRADVGWPAKAERGAVPRRRRNGFWAGKINRRRHDYFHARVLNRWGSPA